MKNTRIEELIMDVPRFIRTVHNIVASVNRSLQTEVNFRTLANAESRLRSLSSNVERVVASNEECQPLLDEVREALNIVEEMKGENGTSSPTRPPTLRTGREGRPSLMVTREQIEFLMELRFSNKAIAEMLQISQSVVKRRIRQYGLSRQQRFSEMTDDELDGHIRRITAGNPHLGQRNVQGQLAAEGHYVQRQRVAKSLVRVDGAAVAMRWAQTIQRRTYQVAGPNSLWHIDGNHKLIRWGIVIHGGIDGFSRMIVFLQAANNNRSGTVMDAFLPAIEEYGVPSRVRCDHGVENLDVATFIELYRGPDRGSVMTGRSVHNQRIERFWRDLYTGCTNVYKSVFESLEASGDLDADNLVDIWCLQYVYLPRLNEDMKRFVDGWNAHSLSTENGRTPRQLFVQGALSGRGQGHSGIEDLFTEGEAANMPEENETTQEITFNVASPVSEVQQLHLHQNVNPLRASNNFGRDIYKEVLDYVRN